MDRSVRNTAAIALLAVVAGCASKNSASDLESPVLPTSGSPVTEIVMKGTVSPALVGSWRYLVGTYLFTKDGLYVVHYDYMRPAGPGRPDTHVVGDDKGSWSADGGYVYLKSARGDVIRDAYKLSADGSKLELTARYSKTPEILQRQKG